MHMPVSAKFRKSPVKSRSRDGRGRGELVIITGMSGSGKASVLKAFEDLGFYCVDNLPVGLIPTFAELHMQGGGETERAALLVDAREGEHLRKLPEVYRDLRRDYPATLVFIEARDRKSTRLNSSHGY